MSAVYADIPLCQSTPELRAWAERHISLKEPQIFQWHTAAPNIFPGLTYFPHVEAYVPLRLNVLRWPSGASRWATYFFLSTDEQLALLRAEVYGEGEEEKQTASRKLILHGSGDTITVNDMWLLPPRPLSETPAMITGKNRLWLCTLVDQRYWWNQDHCGALDEIDTWDALFTHLRDRVGLGTGMDTNAWDCPAVDSDWRTPHEDLTSAHSLPLGLMIDAVAWNVGRRVSLDYEETSAAYPPIIHIREHDWHNTRALANLAQTGWYRMAGGDFEFSAAQRDLSAMIPEKIRMTFADGGEGGFRTHNELDANTIAGYEDENGRGTVVFHNRLDADELGEDKRQRLLELMATAYLGFQSKAAMDIVYTGHVKWMPEALSDVIEWHEIHGEGYCLVPDPKDGKVRKRLELGDMARTRVIRPPFNLMADDLWHGVPGTGSGSQAVADYTGSCPDGTEFVVTISGSTIDVSFPD